MSDNVALHVSGMKIDKFLSYRIDADLYCADDYFSLEFANPGIDIDPGMRCELYVNDRRELTGIIDKVTDSDDKSGSTLAVEGRDLMGLLVDSHVESFPDVEEIALKELAEMLLANVPYINRKNVRYQGGLAGPASGTVSETAAAGVEAMADEQKILHIEPGQSIFDVLSQAAKNRGAMFFALPDGTFVFGRPKTGGQPLFNIVHRKDGKGNNAIKTTRTRDISRRYSKITVIGQQQGYDDIDINDINIGASITDDTVPFYKPMVAVANEDDKSPAEMTRMLKEMQRKEGFSLAYTSKGHSQNGRNWAINELCRVRDAKRNIDGNYLIAGRTFELSKENGRTTEVRLGMPGVAA